MAAKAYLMNASTAAFVKEQMRAAQVNTDAADGNARKIRLANFVPDRMPRPFEVRWAGSENEGKGSWIIWLATGSELLSIGGEYSNTLTDKLDMTDVYPDGWWKLGDGILAAKGSGTVFLKLKKSSSSSGGVEVEFVGDSGYDEGNGVYIQIAYAFLNDETGARFVEQYVDSALVLGDVFGGAGVDAPFEFVVEKDASGSTVRKLVNNTFVMGDETITLADFTAVPTDGTVYLNVTGTKQTTGDGTADTMKFAYVGEISTTAIATKDEDGVHQFSMPLYKFASGKIALDYRTTFLRVNANRVEAGVDGEGYGLISTAYQSGTAGSGSLAVAPLKDMVADVGRMKSAADGTYSVPVVNIGANAIKGIYDQSGNLISNFFGTSDVTLAAGASGVTQTFPCFYSVTYNSSTHQLMGYYYELTFANGVLTNVSGGTGRLIAQAVEES